MTTTAEELLYELAESVRPGARGFHGMCPEMAAKIVREETDATTVAALRVELAECEASLEKLENRSAWMAAAGLPVDPPK